MGIFSSLRVQGGKMLILVTILVVSVSSLPTIDDCSKVATVQLREECTTTQLRVETNNTVQQCKDVIVTQCRHKFSNFPHRTFTSSRVLGTTSTMVASGVRVKHPFSNREDNVAYHKREDTLPYHTTQHQEQGGENCKQVKEKHCQNIPQWKTMPSETCQYKNVTVYVDQCENGKHSENIKSKNPESSPIVGERRAGSSGYLKIVLPLILFIIAAVFLMLWLLSLWMGISFIAAIKIVLEPLGKGLNYARFS